MSGRPPRRIQAAALLGACLLVFAAAAAGALGSIQAPAFYALLDKPAWAPPASLFGPVWSLLYSLLAFALWWVWRAGGLRAVLPLFLAQLLANALWSWLFFAWRLGAWALADVLLLWLLIALTLHAFWRHSRAAALLLVPYFLWVGFALALTLALWQANPGAL